MTDLGLCPFCRSSAVLIEVTRRNAVDDPVKYAGMCDDCAALGPECDTHTHATTAWNTRAELSSLRGEGEGSDVIGRLVGTSMSEIAYQGRWELCIHFGQGDEAKGRMRAASDAIRQALASIPTPDDEP